ncbi:helix-turn-helix transcriptional regulator [Mycolicibacterium insubricum]|uniref:HTH luxR-type domain-containing protein n=1 Tax=Mycolicibacterium insubricum TaxID=444597 RepID=A0A1X0DBG5_9MYCO|nr:helix-turn-helix transcriptional regulator [Mycolicibacterium insubricum]MCV7082478.1 AAA family ATPase [Mycolicibacterium insubricum]ORA69512.1 hypothetical protein BST26_13595 [Mycolicibacterium insubricum]
MVGRAQELAALNAAIDVESRGDAILISGPPGIGRSTLLGLARDRARVLGRLVLSVSGVPQERATPFGGVHQLLCALADEHGVALAPRDVLAERADVATVATALLELLAGLDRSVLLSVDDPRWLDRRTRDVLQFVARRSAGRRLTIVAALPQAAGRELLDRDRVTDIALGPLDRAGAEELLDRRPGAPSGMRRERLLLQAAGNPGALVEFCSALADEPGFAPVSEPLPLPADRLAVYRRLLEDLPPATRSALAVLAAASDDDLSCLAVGAVVDLGALAPAESAGLVRIDGDRLCPLNPLIRSAAYHCAPLTERLDAHRAFVEHLVAQPYRAAWHRAKVVNTDVELADWIDGAAPVLQAWGGQLAAASLLRRAALLSADGDLITGRLIKAARCARYGGDPLWARELADRALHGAGTERLQVQALSERALASTWDVDLPRTIGVLCSVAEEAVAIDPVLGWEPIRAAATATFLGGDVGARAALARGLRLLTAADPSPSLQAAVSRVWVRAVSDPVSAQADAAEISRLAEQAEEPEDLEVLGATAWLAGEPGTALGCLLRALPAETSDGSPPGTPLVLMALSWIYLGTARWHEALRTAEDMSRLARYSRQPLVGAVAELIRAAVLARRGESAAARAHLDSATGMADCQGASALAACAHLVLGTVALNEDRPEAAYAEFGALFTGLGEPSHGHFSYLGVPDWAAAAVRLGDTAEAVRQLDAIVGLLPERRSARTDQLVAHARTLLQPAEPIADAVETLADPRGETWQFERAKFRLTVAGWFRRNYRRTEARREFSTALAVLERLGARLWIDAGTKELRATGIRRPADKTGVVKLSPQEHQVVYLASQGMTNRQIGSLLNVSARTVSGHLYRAFPKLGVTNRRQLRDIEPPTGLSGSVTRVR